MVQVAQRSSRLAYEFPGSFDDWRQRVRRAGSVPVIAVAGSRGKSTVIRVVDAILTAAGLRTATWTNEGVEINGRRQRGELVPWSRALSRLAEGRLDVAIQELDWATLHAVGLPEGIYPIIAVTNVCVNNEECLIHDDARRALRSIPSLLSAVHPEGVAIINGEDHALAGEDVHFNSPAILVAPSPETPLLRGHLRDGGSAAWLNSGSVAIGTGDAYRHLLDPKHSPVTLDGEATFQLVNAMVAESVATAAGIDAETIERSLSQLKLDPGSLPGSFNVLRAAERTIVVDRPDPSWFLRPVLRAVRDIRQHRLITVAGEMAKAPSLDLPEVGRLIGRTSAAVILHSHDQNDAAERSDLLRQGIAMNDVPPVIVHATTERRAINRALKMAREGDVVLILADNAPASVRQVHRAIAGSLSDTSTVAD